MEDAGGLAAPVDTEDVAVAAFRLAPKSFSWRKYPDQIDLDSVRVSLTDACKDKYGSLAVGSVGSGWYISEAGSAWLASKGAKRREELGHSAPEKRLDARMESAHVGREVARVRATRAYRDWTEDGVIDTRDAAAVFRIDRYTSARDRTLKTRRVVEAVEQFGEARLVEFVKEAVKAASQMPGLEPVAGLLDWAEVEEESSND